MNRGAVLLTALAVLLLWLAGLEVSNVLSMSHEQLMDWGNTSLLVINHCGLCGSQITYTQEHKNKKMNSVRCPCCQNLLRIEKERRVL